MNEVNESLYGNKRKFRFAEILLNTLIVVFVLVFACELLFTANFKGIYVVGDSMLPTFTGAKSMDVSGGDYIYINPKASPDYGDVVVVYNEKIEKNIIKRVVAFGGDTVRVVRGALEIKKKDGEDFEAVDEWYVAAENNTPASRYFNFPAHTVADNCMFLLGDNRDVSSDSRDKNNGINGDFPKDCLLGVVPWWSVKYKNLSTGWHTFFGFTIHGKSINNFKRSELCARY